jgi:hypothetical protein
MAGYFDRYNKFRSDAEMKPIPGITILESFSDKFAVYKQTTSRLDKLSNSYYNNPYSGWLIMLANPEFGGLEFNIPDSTIIRIPFPYDSALDRYMTQVTLHKQLYGE